ncbi:MAG: hypothetical protein JF887_11720 [Candidatus Dormibacteraeota bacterium]|uniref:SAF domain-containing protein n=1 Tax=Candidatus Amunia macphersoniae TaxID=3127014 RepID=A0A934KQQ0_9BACT|nr:hypothetical protein [Candidatus Dormibacteraeota bacterium]
MTQHGGPPPGPATTEPRRGRFGLATPGAAGATVGNGGPRSDEPPKRGRRRAWLVALVVVVAAMVFGAAGVVTGRVTADHGPATVDVVALTTAVPAFSSLRADQLRVVTILQTSSVNGLVPATGKTSVVGRIARIDLPPGALLRSAELAPAGSPWPRAGQALVGLALKPGQIPAEGVNVGDVVAAVAVPPGQQGQVVPVMVVPRARVWAVAANPQNVVSVTLLVTQAEAAPLAGYADLGTVSLIRLA